MELPEPDGPTSPPTEKHTMVHGVIIHVGSVEDHITTRCHSFTFCVFDMVDGTSPSPSEDGGHGFAGDRLEIFRFNCLNTYISFHIVSSLAYYSLRSIRFKFVNGGVLHMSFYL